MNRKYYTRCFNLLLFSVIVVINLKAQPTMWQNIGPGAGGAFYSPSISPFNSDEVFFPSDMSDLFHTKDKGASYNIVNFQYITAGTMTKVEFTNDPMILYTINQHEFGNYPMKSTDGGTTWAKLQSDPTSGGAYQLFACETDFNKIIVTDYSNVYYSTNGGTSFTNIYKGNSATWGSYIAGVFWDGTDVYICQPDGLLVSLNYQSFKSLKYPGIPQNEFIVSCTGGKSNGKIRFYAVTNTSCYPGITGADYNGYKFIYVLDYGSDLWVVKPYGLPKEVFPFFIAMAKDNIDIAYVAGADKEGSAPAVYKTTNGGDNWLNVFKYNNNENIRTGWSGQGGDRNWSYGEYALGFTVSRNNPNFAVVTDLGFAHYTSDGGASWEQMYVAKADQNPMNSEITPGKSYHSVGLENTSCWNLCWADANNIVASYTDIKGSRSTDAGISWSFDYTGHNDNTMYYCLQQPGTDSLFAATSTVHDMYQSTYLTDIRIDNGKGKILFSTTKGQEWLVLHDFQHPVIWLALDPSNRARMYASVVHSSLGGIYVCENINAGTNSIWTKLSAPPRTNGHPYNIIVLNDGSLLCSYSGRMTNDRKSFLESSGVFLSTNKGNTWVDKSDIAMHWWTKDIIVDPKDKSQNTWYACVFSGWGGDANYRGGLYKTTNRGTNWTKILDKARVESCTINPENQDEMYVTTEYEGLFITKNLHTANPTFNFVQSYPFKHPMRVFFNPFDNNEIYTTSFGYGIVRGKAGSVEPPDKPILMEPKNNATGQELTLKLKWQNMGNGITYNVQLAKDVGFTNVVENQQNIANNEYDIQDLVANTTYYWHVSATNQAGTGEWSDSWKFTTKEANQDLPGAVILISPEDGEQVEDNKTITFTWQEATNAEKYWIEYADNEQFENSFIDSTIVVTSYTINSLYEFVDKILSWKVKAGNTAGWGNFSQVRTIRIWPNQGVSDNFDNNITVTPNPANNVINISFAGIVNNDMRITITNSLGIELYTKAGFSDINQTILSIDVKEYPSGVYYLNFKSGNKSYVKKIVIIK